MNIGWTDNPIRDALAYDAETSAWLETRPKCLWCGEPIQDDTALELDNGYVCHYCVFEHTKIIPEEGVM